MNDRQKIQAYFAIHKTVHDFYYSNTIFESDFHFWWKIMQHKQEHVATLEAMLIMGDYLKRYPEELLIDEDILSHLSETKYFLIEEFNHNKTNDNALLTAIKIEETNYHSFLSCFYCIHHKPDHFSGLKKVITFPDSPIQHLIDEYHKIRVKI